MQDQSLPLKEIHMLYSIAKENEKVAELLVDKDFNFDQFFEIYNHLKDKQTTKQQRGLLKRLALGHKLTKEEENVCLS